MNMLSSKDFVNQMERDNEALFQASEMQVQAFFESNPSRETLVEHFSGRCANEYINMMEVAQRLLETAPQGDRKMTKLLARQVLDEADHFDLVAKVIERVSGKPVDLEALLKSEAEGGGAKGARILENMPKDDLVALYTYQFIAEGRAHRVWQRMAEVCEDPMIASTYEKIAKDERTHREFGRIGLESALNSPEMQARAAELAGQIRKELFTVSCMNCVALPEAKALVEKAYGPRFLQ
jgi:rubrerythrin